MLMMNWGLNKIKHISQTNFQMHIPETISDMPYEVGRNDMNSALLIK